MDKVENFIKRIRWKAHFFDNPMIRDNDNYTNYGLRSDISPSQNPALTSFENDIYDMVRKVRNDFQDKLKGGINEMRSSKNLFVFADKSTNLYEMSDTDYNRILGNSITSNYRKCENGVKHKILVKRWNVTLAVLPFSSLKITNQTFEITPNAD